MSSVPKGTMYSVIQDFDPDRAEPSSWSEPKAAGKRDPTSKSFCSRRLPLI